MFYLSVRNDETTLIVTGYEHDAFIERRVNLHGMSSRQQRR